jgi:hypothetical protein
LFLVVIRQAGIIEQIKNIKQGEGEERKARLKAVPP